MASELAKKTCVPCKGGVPPMTMDVASRFIEQLDGWGFEQGHLVKTYAFDDFAGALSFVARIGAIAEQQGHHPDIYLTWGKVSVEIWTHKIDGLTESDFILAAKFDSPEGDLPEAFEETPAACSLGAAEEPDAAVEATRADAPAAPADEPSANG